MKVTRIAGQLMLETDLGAFPVWMTDEGNVECDCPRCRGEYYGPDAASYGWYGYPGCISVLDSPYEQGELLSDAILRQAANLL